MQKEHDDDDDDDAAADDDEDERKIKSFIFIYWIICSCKRRI